MPSKITVCTIKAHASLIPGCSNTQKGVADSLKSKALQTNIAASVTSHSCQVWGISAPWHVSNPSYLKPSPPASRQLISPDTSHSPDRESLYPENNPAPLPPHLKSVPAPLSSCLSSLYFSLPALSLSNPSPFLLSVAYSFFHVSICLCQTIYHSCFISLNLSSPCLFSSIHTSSLGISCLRWWESVKRRRDCRLRNSLHFLKDSSAFKNIILFHWWMLLNLEGLYLWAHLYRWREAHRITLGWDRGSINTDIVPSTTITLNILYFLERKESWGTC